jgi:hypothetical protein
MPQAGGIPSDIIVADTINDHGTKCVLGFTCSHAFPDGDDADTEPDLSGPLYYSRIAKGGGWVLEVWANDAATLVSTTQAFFGGTIPASSVAALEQTAANANCG